MNSQSERSRPVVVLAACTAILREIQEKGNDARFGAMVRGVGGVHAVTGLCDPTAAEACHFQDS